MRRDWDIVRQILVGLEELGNSQSVLYARELPPHTDEVVTYNMHLMIQAGLIEGRCVESTGGMSNGWATRLTWKGHEFLDHIREQTVWNRVKATACEKGVSLSFEVIKSLASVVIAAMLK